MPLADPNLLNHTLRPLLEAQSRDPGIAPLSGHCHFTEAHEVTQLLHNSLTPPAASSPIAAEGESAKPEVGLDPDVCKSFVVDKRRLSDGMDLACRALVHRPFGLGMSKAVVHSVPGASRGHSRSRAV